MSASLLTRARGLDKDWLWALVGILFLAVIAVVLVSTLGRDCVSKISGTELPCDHSLAVSEDAYTRTSTDITEAADSAGGDGKPSPQTYRDLGETGRDGDLIFRASAINEVDSLPTLPYTGGPVLPKAGASLVEVVVEVKNDGTTKADPFCGEGGVALLDQEDRNYSLPPSFLDIQGNNWICLNGIEPGFERSATLPFHVPAGERAVGVALWDSEERGDLYGNKSYLVFQR